MDDNNNDYWDDDYFDKNKDNIGGGNFNVNFGVPFIILLIFFLLQAIFYGK